MSGALWNISAKKVRAIREAHSLAPDAEVEVRRVADNGRRVWGVMIGNTQIGRTAEPGSDLADVVGEVTTCLRIIRQQRERACLCCGNSFMSEGAHNRMCDRCRKRS